MSMRISSTELTTKLTTHIEELAKTTDAARMSDVMVEYLQMTTRIHKYSQQNVWLILMAKPDATVVAVTDDGNVWDATCVRENTESPSPSLFGTCR